MTLDAGTPDFLSVTVGTDPINDPLTIALDKDGLALTDCKVYEVSYTVNFDKIPTLDSITRSFTFEIVDACAGATI